jgi:hypothetical protein
VLFLQAPNSLVVFCSQFFPGRRMHRENAPALPKFTF